MSMAVKVPMWVESAVRITADYRDFDGDVTSWKLAFYEIWRFHMTFNFTYEIKVYEPRNDVRISILCKPAFKENALSMLDNLGYKNIKSKDEDVGIVGLLDVEDSRVNNVGAVMID